LLDFRVPLLKIPSDPEERIGKAGVLQREPGHAQQGPVQAEDCGELAHSSLKLVDMLAKDRYVFELPLAGNYGR